MRKFTGQETTHRYMHGLYNTQLEKQGYCNAWEPRIHKRIETVRRRLQRKGTEQIYLHELVITCTAEHLTATLGNLTLSHRGQEGDWFLHALEPMKTLWH